MHPLKEVIRARSRGYLLRHFNLTHYGRNLAALKGIHTGERCFIVGNGPSLTPQDLDKIKNEYTFAFNRIYLMFDKTQWRPTFYCMQDDKMAAVSVAEVKKNIETKYIFTPINLYWYDGLDFGTQYYFSPKRPPSEDVLPDFSEDISHYIGLGTTVAYTAIQIAAFMGFKQIYLLGVDHNFRVSQTKEGKLLIDNSVKDYFTDSYNADQEKLYIPRIDVATLSYFAAQKYTEHHDVSIYNATRGGKLEVFPRVDFDSIV